MTMRYFIFDCNDNIVGNKNGYRTFKGANTQANSRHTKLYHKIWDIFDNRKNKSDNMVNSIKFMSINSITGINSPVNN